MSHEELSAFLNQARLRSSLVEVLIHKRDRLSEVIFGRVASVSLHGVELNVRGSGMTRYFDFCGADVMPYGREKSFGHGWKVHSCSGHTLIFFELPQQQQIAA